MEGDQKASVAVFSLKIPYFSSAILSALGFAGWKSHLFADRSFFGGRFSRHCTFFHLLPSTTTLEEKVQFMLRALPRDCMAIIPCDLKAALVLNQFKHLIPFPLFPLSPSQTIESLNDKWKFAELMKTLDLPHPRTFLIKTAKDLESAPLEFPFLTKALSLSGGRGMKKWQNREQIKKEVSKKNYKSDSSWIAQEIFPGALMGLSILSHEGNLKAWSLQVPSPKRKGLQTYQFIENEKIVEGVKKILAYTHYTGVAHFDLLYRQDSQEFCFLECNPRFWASLDLSTWMGINYLDLGLQLLTGAKNFKPQEKSMVGSITRFSYSRWISSLIRGRRLPIYLNEKSRRAWKESLKDPVPAIADRAWTFAQKFKRSCHRLISIFPVSFFEF